MVQSRDLLLALIKRFVEEGMDIENHVIWNDKRVRDLTAEYKQSKWESSL